MRTYRRLVALLFATWLAFGTVASAQTAEAEVEAAVRSLYEAIKERDVAKITDHYLQGGNTFTRGGSLLVPVATGEELQGLFDAGLKYEVYLHHLDVKVFGDSAVATWYTSGPTAQPDGTVLKGAYRCSGVWIKRENQWKAAHFHISPLQSGPA